MSTKAPHPIQERLDAVIQSVDGIVWEADAQTFDFTFVSERAERLLGFSVEEWLQPGFWVANLHTDDKSWAPAYCASCTAKLLPHDFEYRFIAKNGATVWLRDIITVAAEDGRPKWLRGIMVDITESKRIQAELAAQNTLHESLLLTMPFPLSIVDKDGRVRFSNALLKQAVGRAIGDECCWMVFRDNKQQCIDCPLKRSIQVGKTQTIESAGVLGGKTFEIHHTGMIYDGEETVMEIFLDITERKRAEETHRRLELQLRESDTFNRAIVQGAQEGVIVYDRDLRYAVWNPFMERFTGRSAQEVLGRRPWEIFSFLDKAGVTRNVERALAGEMSRSVDFYFAIDGTNCSGWASDTTGPLRNANGEIIGVIATVSDITERKRMEEQLRTNEAQYRSLFEAAPVPIWEEDFSEVKTRVSEIEPVAKNNLRGYLTAHPEETLHIAKLVRIVNVNEASTRFFEASTKLELLTNLAVFFDDDSLAVFSEEIAVLADGASHFESEMPIRDLNGARRFVMLYLDICPGYEESWSKVYVSFTDITERKRLEKLHLQAQKLESLGTLAGGIAHDFNNILAAIKGNVDLAAEDVGENRSAMESLAEIRKAVERATELVRRIMTFGRPKKPHREVIDLAGVVGEVLQLLRSTLPAGIALKTRFACDVPRVHADSAQVHEVVVNLTTNAAYAIGLHAGSIEYLLDAVQVSGEKSRILSLPEGLHARLTVRDSGVGMDEVTKSRIFDAFYTTKPVGEGTGLGLSMVYGIMKSHAGAVTVESAPGKGSSFYLYFPAVEEDDEPRTKTKAAFNRTPLASRRVMYVDDEYALVSLATRALTRLGHGVTGFASSREALVAFLAHPENFDIIVTDLAMPEMQGFQLAEELLAIRPGVPVIMTTGYLRAEDEERARAMGIRELIIKPIAIDNLAMIIDRLCRDLKNK